MLFEIKKFDIYKYIYTIKSNNNNNNNLKF